MLLNRQKREQLNKFFETIKLSDKKNKQAKIEQIIAYLEVIHANMRKYSKKRPLVFFECGAGNSYLSFLVGFEKMFFHADDIITFKYAKQIDLVYSLHACDSATDKSIYFGIAHNARCILSVSCCQHSLRKNLRNNQYRGITKHSIFKERMVYMVADSMRSLLIEQYGYQTSIFEFVSSRHTDKNVLLRANRGNQSNTAEIKEEYTKMCNDFKVSPNLETYLKEAI
jgi:hypothetical protein